MSKSTKTPLSQALVKEIKAHKKRRESQEASSKVSKKGSSSGWTRATIVIKEDHKDKLARLAFWSELDIKDVLEKILDTFFRDKEIRPIPKLQKEEISKLLEMDQELEI